MTNHTTKIKKSADYITKINKIENLEGVFSDYFWGKGPQGKKIDLPEFKGLNFIYGFNGNGKTTLSRLFKILGESNIKRSRKFRDVKYKIEVGSGEGRKQYSEKDSFSKYPRQVKVFNRDYIDKNIKIQRSSANPLSISIVLGETNKKFLDQIDKDMDLQKKKKLEIESYRVERQKIREEYNDMFKDVASKIRSRLKEESGLGIYRKDSFNSYYIGNAKKRFEYYRRRKFLGNKNLIEVGEEGKCTVLLQVRPLDKINNVVLGKGINQRRCSILETIESLTKRSEKLLIKIIEPNGIDGLGMRSSVLNKEIDNTIRELEEVQEVIDKISIPNMVYFYRELVDDIEAWGAEFKSTREKLVVDIKNLCCILKDKKNKTTEPIKSDKKLDSTKLLYVIDNINNIINQHNERVTSLEEERKKVKRRLEFYYLNEIYDGVVEKEAHLNSLRDKIIFSKREIEEIRKRITNNARSLSSEQQACNSINDNLKEFLGYEEIKFEPYRRDNDEEIVSYNILRNGRPAEYLSEGEKTAIALIYFLVHLKEKDSSVGTNIIVIDDPISSLDSNFLYQAFSFLKNAMQDVIDKNGQVFILTHHFGFLRLLLNWKRYKRNKKCTGYYMIKNFYDSSHDRKAYIDKMDKELCEYESEYHYLFKLLKEGKRKLDENSSIANTYRLPNIARKVWESFLMYRVPNGKEPSKKMKELLENVTDEEKINYERKLDYINRFINRQSHINGSDFDPAIIEEAKKVIKAMFDIMRKTAKEHYEIIDRVTEDEGT